MTTEAKSASPWTSAARSLDAVKKELKNDKIEVKLNPVTSATRIPLVANGTVRPRMRLDHQ